MSDKDTCVACGKPIAAGIGKDGNRVPVERGPGTGTEPEDEPLYMHSTCWETRR